MLLKLLAVVAIVVVKELSDELLEKLNGYLDREDQKGKKQPFLIPFKGSARRNNRAFFFRDRNKHYYRNNSEGMVDEMNDHYCADCGYCITWAGRTRCGRVFKAYMYIDKSDPACFDGFVSFKEFNDYEEYSEES